MTMGKKYLHLYHHFGNKTIFMQATNTYTIKTNIISVSTDEGNDSSKPAQSGIRKFDCFGSTNDLIAFEFDTKQFRLHNF